RMKNNRTGLKVLPASYIGVAVRIEIADPGMCDFPVRRESGTRNRIPGDFFAYFFGRAKKEMPRRHKASGETGAPVAGADKKEQVPAGIRRPAQPMPRHKRAKKRQTPVGERQS
ncbi:hypothetical protein, partial [Rikenella microfusus]|uniref:hypothetical protein n=1 Tax=Rikenella microfusus TaxID=28139 RepID=UPI00248F08F3